MSLDKAIENGKEKRKPYSGAKAVDKTCRNHGTCGYCMSNRTYSTRKREASVDDQLEDYYNGNYDNYDNNYCEEDVI